MNLVTDLGPVVLTFTDPEHVHIETHKGQPLVIRGVKYRLSLHLNLYDGSWSLSRNKDTQKPERYLLTLKKVEADGSPIYHRDDEASDSARDKAYDVVAKRVNVWYKDGHGDEILAALRVTKAEERLSAADGKVTKLAEELAEAQREAAVAKTARNEAVKAWEAKYGKKA